MLALLPTHRLPRGCWRSAWESGRTNPVTGYHRLSPAVTAVTGCHRLSPAVTAVTSYHRLSPSRTAAAGVGEGERGGREAEGWRGEWEAGVGWVCVVGLGTGAGWGAVTAVCHRLPACRYNSQPVATACPIPEFREILLKIWVEAHFSKFLAKFGVASSAPRATATFGKFHVLIPKLLGTSDCGLFGRFAYLFS